MTFDDYQKKAIKTDVYGGRGDFLSTAFINKILGLVGETGEVAERIKKVQRNDGGKLDQANRQAILKELGDVLWYLSAIAHYLDEPLGKIAEGNLAKLADRHARGVIKSEGDSR
ncbi:MAG TPA: nucleoside triphosphate pyrophosphohydrolase family protein [Candidatus Saccharimonadales bacterium]|nr:nucleoside triphosphate pyrophosphohydrolase family protein [Candidatus Saccharimonadales bacterium]